MTPTVLFKPGEAPEQGSTLDDLLKSKARSVIAITAVSFLAAATILSAAASIPLMSRLFGISIVFGLVSLAAYRMLEKRYLLAQVFWQATLAGLIFSSSAIFGRAEVVFFAALLPFISAITLGWRFAVIAELAVAGLLAWVQTGPGFDPLPADYPGMILSFAAFGGLLGWTATTHLLAAASWALYSFGQARQNLEEAREQRLELQQSQEDLSKANLELARLIAAKDAYAVPSFPTVILLDPDGTEVGRVWNYKSGTGPAAYLAALTGTGQSRP